MSDSHGPLPDPRASLGPPTPRLPIPEARPPISAVCSCGLPNCTRVTPHHHHQGAPHPPGYSPEGAGYGLGLPIGGAPPVGHVDPALIYSMQGAAYGLKDNPEMLRSLPQLNGYYPYDPTSVYPYMNGYAGIDARRKNATKESTNTLKAWLFEHRKNPYPTKGEKIMLAILTRMTLTQVSTWFANARRRLKKENKMTWSSKDDDLDDEAASEHNSDVNDRGDVSGNSSAAHAMNGSIGDDDDDILSITSDKSDIDVEDNGDDMHRVPPLLPHTLAGHAAAHHPAAAAMYLRNQHAEYLTSLGQSATSAAVSKVGNDAMESDDKQEAPVRPLSPVSPCSSLKSERATPPPSPKDGNHTSSQSQSSSHSQTHHSTATIHHHPTVTSTATSPKSVSDSTPEKPKIWSIADVVSSKDNNNEVTNKSSSGSSTSHSGPTPIVTIGGVPARMDLMNGGIPPHGIPAMMLPGSEAPYGLTYYPYGVPHPAAAAAIMASHASHLASRVHPYSRLPAGMPHHHHPHLSGHREFPAGIPRPSQQHPQSSVAGPPGSAPVAPQLRSPVPEARRPVDMSRKQDVPRVEEVSTTCTPTAFTPVAQRQV